MNCFRVVAMPCKFLRGAAHRPSRSLNAYVIASKWHHYPEIVTRVDRFEHLTGTSQ
jgi:hypothetical protein